jgi:hypothetical protein
LQAISSGGKPNQRDRVNKKGITIWLEPDVHTQLKVSASYKQKTLQEVMEEALDDWFRKNHEHRFLKTDRLRSDRAS